MNENKLPLHSGWVKLSKMNKIGDWKECIVCFKHVWMAEMALLLTKGLPSIILGN